MVMCNHSGVEHHPRAAPSSGAIRHYARDWSRCAGGMT
jgi:hypothetical protein